MVDSGDEYDAGVSLSTDDVRHVARLARLRVEETELEPLREELARIIDHVSAIAELDLADVPPTSHPLDLVNVTAVDQEGACVSLDEALANAPDPADGGFRVPPIL